MEDYDTKPKKLEWKLTPDLRAGVRYAETRISDLICQNDSQALEFKGYGSAFMKRHGFSPDAFVQMAFQAAYYGLYGEVLSDVADSGRVESTYEPAMTKAFLHGRTEAIRTVQPESVAFVKVRSDDMGLMTDLLVGQRYARGKDQGSAERLQATYPIDQGMFFRTRTGQASPPPTELRQTPVCHVLVDSAGYASTAED